MDIFEPPMQVCTKCFVKKYIYEYHRNMKKNRVHLICKDCERKRRKEYDDERRINVPKIATSFNLFDSQAMKEFKRERRLEKMGY